MEPVLLKLENVGVSLGGKNILNGVCLEIRRGEQWAIVGPSGSGKTVLVQALSGKLFFHGRVTGDFDDPASFLHRIVLVEQQHRFRDLSNQSDFYYQQRYNAHDSSGTLLVQDDLAAYSSPAAGFSKEELIHLFELGELLTEPLIQLSNGENKRLQIVKAMLTPHELLILDQPFTGLDREGRKLLRSVFGRLSRMGEQMILITGSRDIPDCFTRVAEMKSGTILRTGCRADFADQAGPDDKPVKPKKFPSAITFQYPGFEYAVRMTDVNVQYDEKPVLSGIDWKIKKGECWSLSGPNGAGKSTLLSLITGDNPQAYANEIYLFDRKRGTGESIWEIKQKTGLLSPELHLYFDRSSTVYQAIASGLWDTIGLFRALSSDQHELVAEWLDFLDLSTYQHALLSSLPAGLQRMALLGRAMIKTPPLLVLDEPAQGLDDEHIRLVRDLIDRYIQTYDGTLIFVSHYPEELPGCVDRFLSLQKGRIVQ